MNKYRKDNASVAVLLRRTGALLGCVAWGVTVSAQEVRDTLLENFVGTDAVDNWKKQQPSEYAFDYLLQQRPVAKHYAGKRFGDRLFLEGGVNLLSPLTRKQNLGLYLKDWDPSFHVALGDWATPLHGWRVSFQAGEYGSGARKSDVMGASLDYLLNITAVAASQYQVPRAFEVYGVAGVDYFRSEWNGQTDDAFGFHMGLRGQWNMGKYTYLFLEPRLGLYSDELLHMYSWRGYNLAGTVLAGLGYRLTPSERSRMPYTTSGSFLDNTFFSLSGGPSLFLNSPSHHTTRDKFGVQGRLHLGKWFNPYSGLRLGVGASVYTHADYPSLKSLSASAGYLWNLHNTFGGYDAGRRFWINAVADVSVNVGTHGAGRHTTFGFGGGLQPNVNLAKGVDLFIEPRVDLYGHRYAMNAGSNSGFDVVGSLMAGLAFRQGLNTREQLQRNDDFEQKSWYDHIFLEGGLGGTLPITPNSVVEPFRQIRPMARLAAGKWLTATSGVRLWGEGGQYEDDRETRHRVLAAGADYLWNLTNAFHGYDAGRPCELVASAGLNLAALAGSRKVYVGANAGLKGTWYLNDMVGLYLEPQLRFYKKDFLKAGSLTTGGPDVMGSLMAGLQFRMAGYRPSEAMAAFAGDERTSYISWGIGAGTTLNAPRVSANYGMSGRLSYGRWLTPAAGWRINATGLIKPRADYRYALAMAGADYMVDMTTLAYGYNPDRWVSVRAFAGAGIGADYKGSADPKMHLIGDVHAGGQLAVRAGSRNEIFLEPQASYLIGGKPMSGRSERMLGTLMLGLNHKLRYVSGGGQLPAPERDEFVSFSIGTGAHTGSLFAMSPFGRKLTLDFDLSYGRWYNGVSGMRLGLSDATVQRRGRGNQHITSFHADYLFNLLALSGGVEGMETDWRLNGFVGAELSLGTKEGMRPAWAPGLQAGLQLGYMLTPACELFAEPAAVLTGKNVWRGSSRPAEGQLRLMLGTKYHF